MFSGRQREILDGDLVLVRTDYLKPQQLFAPVRRRQMSACIILRTIITIDNVRRVGGRRMVLCSLWQFYDVV